MNIEQARFNMVKQQIRPWEVLDRRVLEVILQTPREEFVPHQFRQLAFTDTDIPLAHNQFMLRPVLEGRILQSLDLRTSDTVLEIGTGSGYLTACLAQLAGHVESVDIYPEFIEQAKQKLAIFDCDNVSLSVGDAAQQWGQANQYDAIAVTGALPSVPEAYKRALATDGRLFVIIGQADKPIMEAMLITRKGKNQWMQESLFETWVSPLINATGYA
ncbi:MAG: protein-L-isoaspartate O-methyltransferase [Gammaproteobacteria bacterium]|nr:protein-L-isoaspartate O-methyltransferase [Gammaproteobacteria bacterium]